MKITLVVAGNRHEIDLNQEGFTIGRDEAATIRVDSSSVSRVHAKIYLKDDEPHLTDLDSLSGTALNGATIKAPAVIRPGDSIQLGKVKVQWPRERPG